MTEYRLIATAEGVSVRAIDTLTRALDKRKEDAK